MSERICAHCTKFKMGTDSYRLASIAQDNLADTPEGLASPGSIAAELAGIKAAIAATALSLGERTCSAEENIVSPNSSCVVPDEFKSSI